MNNCRDIRNLKSAIRIPKRCSTPSDWLAASNMALRAAWFAALIAGPNTLQADTLVSGTIVNQIWTRNNSPYVVTGDIQVARLTIQPGVTIVTTSNNVFEVAGVLKAVGSPEAPILFTSTNGGWQGLFFNSARPGCALAHCIIEKSVNSGIRIVSTSPWISDCIIRSNSLSVSTNGGRDSVSMEAGGGGIRTDSFIALDNCAVMNNSVVITVTADYAVAIGKGGGIYSTAPLVLRNCTISSNSVSANGRGSFPTSSENSFSQGGGVWSTTNLLMQSCLIKANFAHSDTSINNGAGGSSVSRGGGVWSSGRPILRNSILNGNQAIATAMFWTPVVDGGGMYISQNGSLVENCTFAFNAPNGLSTDTNTSAVLNTIVWANTLNQIGGTVKVTYSDIQGGYPGEGNINLNPIFLSSDNLIIVDGSPCIDAGSTNAAYFDLCFPPSLGRQRNDMGAHGGPGAGARFRGLSGGQFEVILLGAVPGYNYLIEASTNLLDWEIVQQVQTAHVGDAAYFLEPSTNTLRQRFYKLKLSP